MSKKTTNEIRGEDDFLPKFSSWWTGKVIDVFRLKISFTESVIQIVPYFTDIFTKHVDLYTWPSGNKIIINIMDTKINCHIII
jgi:hypothetical protein